MERSREPSYGLSSPTRRQVAVSCECPSSFQTYILRRLPGGHQIPRWLEKATRRRRELLQSFVGNWPGNNSLHPPARMSSAHGDWDRVRMTTLDHRNRPRPQRRPTPRTANDRHRGPSATPQQIRHPHKMAVYWERHQAVSSCSTAARLLITGPFIHQPTVV